jgi:hypothetical protein
MVPKGPSLVVITVPLAFAVAEAGAVPRSGPTPIPEPIMANEPANETAAFFRVSRRMDMTIYPPVVD